MTDEPIRVMVVDDHPMWRDAVERDLAAAGFDVVAAAANGREALARFPAARPQVVVLDLQIPAPNGVEVTAEILRQDPSARVLILSASGEQADVLDAVKAGATGYLVKSASRAELVDLQRQVDMANAARQLASGNHHARIHTSSRDEVGLLQQVVQLLQRGHRVPGRMSLVAGDLDQELLLAPPADDDGTDAVTYS